MSPSTPPPEEGPRIENLLLANHVEAVNGMLYIAGGGWTEHWRPATTDPTKPVVSRVSVALTTVVPWTASGVPYPLLIRVLDAADNQIASVTMSLGTTRPPGLPTGADLHSVVAAGLSLVFPVAGEYRLLASLAGRPPREAHFRVHDLVQPPTDLPAVN